MKPAGVGRWYLLSTARKVRTDLVTGMSTRPRLLKTLGFISEAPHPRNPRTAGPGQMGIAGHPTGHHLSSLVVLLFVDTITGQ